MSNQHTPEPWTVLPPSRACNPYVVASSETELSIADCYSLIGGNCEANARRIVACVNACSGYPVEQIEEYAATGGFHANAETNFLEFMAVTRQRDELQAELENIASADTSKWDAEVRDQFQQWAQSRARAAIAKAKG